MRTRTFGPLFCLAMLTVAPGVFAQVELELGTYLGGSGTDRGTSFDVDADGFVYLCGYTESPDIPGAINTKTGFVDWYVSKLSPDFTEVLWTRYIGGTEPGAAPEYPADIAADGQGGCVVIGKTSSTDFPLINALDNSLSGVSDAAIVRLNTDGSIAWSTLLGGSGGEMADGFGYSQITGEIEIASDGSIVIAGDTRSSNFPTVNPIDGTFGGFNADVFVARLSADGQHLLWSTYLGDLYRDQVWDLRLDADDNPVICGDAGPDWPEVAGSYTFGQFTSSGIVYATKLAFDGSHLLWSAKMDRMDNTGGSVLLRECAIAPDGSIYVAGRTSGAGFPVPPDAYQPEFQGGQAIMEGIVFRLSPDGTQLLGGTFLGDFNSEDEIGTIDVDANGTVFVGLDRGVFSSSVRLVTFNAELTELIDTIAFVSVASFKKIRTDQFGDLFALIETFNAATTPGVVQPVNPSDGQFPLTSPYIAKWDIAGSPITCAGDLTGDARIDLADLNLVLGNFGQATTHGDATGDGVVDLADLNTVLASFGLNCN